MNSRIEDLAWKLCGALFGTDSLDDPLPVAIRARYAEILGEPYEPDDTALLRDNLRLAQQERDALAAVLKKLRADGVKLPNDELPI